MLVGGAQALPTQEASALGICLMRGMSVAKERVDWPHIIPKPGGLETREAMLMDLRSSDEAEISGIGAGIHRPYRIVFGDGMDIGPMTTRMGVFKTVHSQMESKRYVQSVDMAIVGPEREILAYEFDRVLGFDLVPPTVGRYVQRIGFGSVQAWVNAPTAWQWLGKGYDWRRDLANPWVHRIAAFHFVTAAIDGHCLAQGTLVKTRRGHVAVEFIVPGDFVLTGAGRWMPVLSVVAKAYSGRMVEICARRTYERVVVTPEHRFPVARRVGAMTGRSRNGAVCVSQVGPIGDVEMIPASDLSRRDVMLYPVRKTTDRAAVALPPRMCTRPKRPMPDPVPVDENLMALIGWYLAEGSMARRNVKGRRYITGVQFSLGTHEVEYIKEISDRMAVYGIPVRLHLSSGGSATCVDAFNSDFGRLMLELCGENSHRKRLSEWIVELPDQKLRPLIDAYFRGDGATDGKWKRPSTSSFELAHQIRDMVIKIGRSACIGHLKARKPGRIGNRRIVCGEQWQVNWTDGDVRGEDAIHVDGYLSMPIRSVREFMYEGIVYDIEVAGDHTFCTSTMVSHNSNNAIIDERRRWYSIDNGYSFTKHEGAMSRGYMRSSPIKHLALADMRIHPDTRERIAVADDEALRAAMGDRGFRHGEANGMAERLAELRAAQRWRDLRFGELLQQQGGR